MSSVAVSMETKPTADSGCLQQWLVHSVKSLRLTESGPVQRWMEDVRQMTDGECMCVLQGKSLMADTTEVVITATRSYTDSISTITGRAHVIATEFTKLSRKVTKERWKHVKSGALRLTCQIRSLLHECHTSVIQPSAAFSQEEQAVMEECAKLVRYVESQLEVNGHQPDKKHLVQQLTVLGEAFSALVDLSLRALLQSLMRVIRDNVSAHEVKATLSGLVSLGLQGDHMCSLISQESGMDTLLSVCKDPSMEFAQAQALRVIATVCCVPESIARLDKLEGIACMSELLADTVVMDTVRAEAAGVVAQVTSPCLEQYQHLTGFIENLADLVNSLTVLCVEASSPEVFLLGSAALANITFMDSLACDYLLQYDTASILIEACMLNKAESLFSKDQVATVLCNMSGVEACTEELVESHGVELLVHLLSERPEEARSGAELAACQRILQKSATALARLSRDRAVADRVVDLDVVPRLVQLCRDPFERNDSDAVLIACLNALRKVCTISCHLGDDLDVTVKELIEPKMVDSFILCSNLDESIV